jgi:hypothetical protein
MNPAVSEAKLKCVTFIVFEKNGKTILQPIIRGQEIQNLHELFQKNTLEVWLPNGRPDFEQFDVGILKYKQIVQPSKVCSKVKNRECMKNHFETIISCEQCPLSSEVPQTRHRKEHAQLPNLSLQLRRLGKCST